MKLLRIYTHIFHEKSHRKFSIQFALFKQKRKENYFEEIFSNCSR